MCQNNGCKNQKQEYVYNEKDTHWVIGIKNMGYVGFQSMKFPIGLIIVEKHKDAMTFDDREGADIFIQTQMSSLYELMYHNPATDKLLQPIEIVSRTPEYNCLCQTTVDNEDMTMSYIDTLIKSKFENNSKDTFLKTEGFEFDGEYHRKKFTYGHYTYEIAINNQEVSVSVEYMGTDAGMDYWGYADERGFYSIYFNSMIPYIKNRNCK